MNIKHIREKYNISQQNLAELLSVDRSTVAKWETGKALPTADKLPKLAQILKCNIDELFEHENKTA